MSNLVYLKTHSILDNSRFIRMFLAKKMDITYNPDDADLIVFGGGSDINPKLYDQKPHESTHFSDVLDSSDIALYNKYKGKNMVGICRGAQLGHVLAGGSLIQDINNHYGDHYATVGGATVKLPSDHHQSMSDPNVGDVLALCRTATKKEIMNTDGFSENIQEKLPFDIEIMYHPNTKFLSMQAHPEYAGVDECTKTFFNFIKKIFNIG